MFRPRGFYEFLQCVTTESLDEIKQKQLREEDMVLSTRILMLLMLSAD